MVSHARSPYARAIGDRMTLLHPTLRRYFDGVPDGHVGIGEGVFDRIGARYRWMRFLLIPLQRRHVVFAGAAADVPFAVRNTIRDGRARAERTLLLGDRSWTMVDAVSFVGPSRIVDVIGLPETVAASFDVSVEEGALRLTSRSAGIRIGRFRLTLPPALSPRVTLTERFDEATARQRVDLRITLPLLGCVYEYTGGFDYRIEEDRD
ncbi:hypothetical protein GCM10011490_00770 [Pseudoclavibacter endophyticus]|uniref:DUF4166 domain-containing protein n=1 Tax=Pseudoclavibacter endophyticus TaxID=1778590 RepID=A0A6H9WHG0_9MICO|nr:DUF4166 domain-containing protein [Pseudoclavibacter endophyticus]KAB1650362.1 DUF4166 domain-containing protein [Pseudoclavibacter endophyticus]GGA54823.1 hypothetical protein GCM10011490_00770 [Pseudoclavibacter endophyticus]